MTAFVELHSEITSEVPQADVILIERAIKRAARAFCERTEVLRATAPAIDIVEATAEYTLPPVDKRDIVRAVRGGVWWGTEFPLTPKSEDQLDRDAGGMESRLIRDGESVDAVLVNSPWQTDTGAQSVYYFQRLPHLLRLVPIPNTSLAAQLVVTYALKPSLAATEVDDFVLAYWYEHIVAGALAELFKEPKKPWTDTPLAVHWGGRFDAGIAKVTNERVGGFADNDYAVGRTRTWL